MATLKSLEQALRSIFKEKSAIPGQPLSDTQYSNGFATMVEGSKGIYQEFIVPQLAQLFANFDAHISLLEIGPGLTSRSSKIGFAIRREASYRYLVWKTDIHRTRFPHSNPEADSGRNAENFDVIPFCHSLYGISPKRVCIERSLEMLTDRHKAGIVVVFHREHTLRLDGLVSHRRASLPTGAVKVLDEDARLDSFASFTACIQWVYDVARNLLPVSHGVYGADLGPDPRDPSLAAEAFKSNGPRLAGVKRGCDPYEVLAYGCPVPKTPTVIILVTGLIGSGKDYCASIWASRITAKTNQALTTRVASISEAIKRAYAAATGCELDRLLFLQRAAPASLDGFLPATGHLSASTSRGAFLGGYRWCRRCGRAADYWDER
ncbi:hypothetical protein BDW68DRAFT_182275 [Aspergillus falconensis]